MHLICFLMYLLSNQTISNLGIISIYFRILSNQYILLFSYLVTLCTELTLLLLLSTKSSFSVCLNSGPRGFQHISRYSWIFLHNYSLILNIGKSLSPEATWNLCFAQGKDFAEGNSLDNWNEQTIRTYYVFAC